MPSLSPTMTQGNIGTWLKKVGDVIAPGDILVEIETDKAQMEFECQDDGYLAKILLENGSKDVLVGTPMAIMCEDESNVAQFQTYTPDTATTGTVVPEPEKPQDPVQQPQQPQQQPKMDQTAHRTFISSMARSMATQNNIDVSQMTGSGPNNRIVKADIELMMKQGNTATTPAPVKKQAASMTTLMDKSSAAYFDVPMSTMRKVIAARLTESKQSIPHYYVTSKVNMDRLIKLRQVLNATEYAGKHKTKLSINDFVVKASALALKAHPQLNVSYVAESQSIRQYTNVDISIAVATETGLITPIVHNANQLGLGAISQQVKGLANKAKLNQLMPHEYSGGSFTISNLGMFNSVSHFTAIINPPQSAILAVSGMSEELVRSGTSDKDGNVGVHASQVMNVCLSSDHRVIDGAVAAQFMASFKKYMEEPLLMLM